MAMNRCKAHLSLSTKRFLCDMAITSLQVLFIYFIGLLILGYTPMQICLSWKCVSFNSFSIAFLLAIIHSIYCCYDDVFFRKFGFLLPEDITYYVFAHNNRLIELEEKIDIRTPKKSEIISDEGKFDQTKCLCYNILSNKDKKFFPGETKCFAPMLHIYSESNGRINRKIDPTNKCVDSDLKMTWNSLDNIDSNIRWLGKIKLLISKNVILLLFRSIMLLFLLFLMLSANPPLQIIVDPQSINENITIGTDRTVVLSIQNIGCELSSITAKILAASDSRLHIDGDKWNSESQVVDLSEGEVEFVKLKINGTDPGVDRGFVLIREYAFRRTSIASLDKIPIVRDLYIPFKITVQMK